MPVLNSDKVLNIKMLAVLLTTIIKTRYHIKVKPVYTKGIYPSAFISFHRSGNQYQFYIQDEHSVFSVRLMKNNSRTVRRDWVRYSESIDGALRDLMYFFDYVR